MNHANAPLTPEGRLRLVRRCAHRPIAHVAAEAGISRQCLSKWKSRFDDLGEVGLLDRASVPHACPTQLDPDLVALIGTWRREHKWSARAIHLELTRRGHDVSLATVGRWLARLGISWRRDIDPDGSSKRTPGRIMPATPDTWCIWTSRRSGASPTAVAGEPTAAARRPTRQPSVPRPRAPAPATSTWGLSDERWAGVGLTCRAGRLAGKQAV